MNRDRAQGFLETKNFFILSTRLIFYMYKLIISLMLMAGPCILNVDGLKGKYVILRKVWLRG